MVLNTLVSVVDKRFIVNSHDSLVELLLDDLNGNNESSLCSTSSKVSADNDCMSSSVSEYNNAGNENNIDEAHMVPIEQKKRRFVCRGFNGCTMA